MWMKTASDDVMFYIYLALGSFKIDSGNATTALVTFSGVSKRSQSSFGTSWELPGTSFGPPWGSLGSFWAALGRVL